MRPLSWQATSRATRHCGSRQYGDSHRVDRQFGSIAGHHQKCTGPGCNPRAAQARHGFNRISPTKSRRVRVPVA